MVKCYAFYWLVMGWYLLAGVGGVHAQYLNGYHFQAQAGTYSPLGNGATRLPALEADEAVVHTIPLGFAFAANEQFHAQASISSNGWLHLGSPVPAGALPGQYPNLAPNIFWLAAPLWADLSGTGGAAYYQTTGTAPNRVFTMEWRDWRWDPRATQAVLSFQVKLYEGTNQVEFCYGAGVGSVSNSVPAARAMAGLQWESSGSRYVLLLNNLGPTATVDGSVPAAILAKPAAGQHYTYMPSPVRLPACPVAQQVRLLLRRANAKVSWTMPGGAVGPVRVHFGPRGFVLGSADDAVATGTPADTAQLTGLLPNQQYEYLVEQECVAGASTGRSSRQSFRTYQTPANDNGSQALWLPVLPDLRAYRLTSGTARYATATLPPVPNCGPTPAGGVRDVWYAFRATQRAQEVHITSASTDFVVEVRDGWGSGSQTMRCGTTAPSTFWVGRTIRFALTGLTVGKAYFVRLYPTSAIRPDSPNDDYQDAFTIGVIRDQTPAPVPPNQTCAQAISLPVASTPDRRVPTTGSLKGATVTRSYPLPEVWYTFTAPGARAEVYFHPQFEGVVEWNDSCNYLTGRVIDTKTKAGGVARLALSGLTGGQNYLLKVYASRGIEDSTFQLAVSGPPLPPANDDCAAALLLPLTARGVVGQRGTLAGATSSGLAPGSGCNWNGDVNALPSPPAAAHDVWYRFTATAAVQVLTLNAATDAIVEVLATSANQSPCAAGAAPVKLGCAFALASDFANPAQTLPGRTLLTGLTVGQSYWVRVYAARLTTPQLPAGEPGFELSLHLWEVPANDEPANARPLTVSPSLEPCTGSGIFTLDGATPSLPSSGTAPTARDVWFSFVAPAAIAPSTFSAVAVRFNFSAPLVSGVVELRDGPDANSSVRGGTGSGVGIRQINEGGFPSTYLTPGHTYYLRVVTTLPHPEPQPNYSICLAALPVNDEPCGALPLVVDPITGQCQGTVRGTTFGASTSTANNGLLLPVSNCDSGSSMADVWYRVVPSSTAFALQCNDISLDLARLYQPISAQGCAGTMRLVNCQSSLQYGSTESRPLGKILFDQLTPGQPYYLALSGDGFSLPTRTFTLCAQVATSLPTRPAVAWGACQAWPNPIPAGQLLTLELPGALLTGVALRVDWLTTLGQVLPGGTTGRTVGGRLQVPTAGRQPGLYLLRVWAPDGQSPALVRVVVE